MSDSYRPSYINIEPTPPLRTHGKLFLLAQKGSRHIANNLASSPRTINATTLEPSYGSNSTSPTAAPPTLSFSRRRPASSMTNPSIHQQQFAVLDTHPRTPYVAGPGSIRGLEKWTPSMLPSLGSIDVAMLRQVY